MAMLKIAVGCDPNAASAKAALMQYLGQKGFLLTDFGSDDPIYANVAIKVAEAVSRKEYDRGILICGTGLGVSIAANKVKGAYAALITDVYAAMIPWIEANGYETAGPMFNIYHVSPHDTKNPDEFVTEVCYPVKKK